MIESMEPASSAPPPAAAGSWPGAGSTGAAGEFPTDLETLAPGPELARLLASIDRREISERDRVRLLQARQRLISHLQAELMADLTAITWEDQPEPDGSGRYAWAETEIACALRWTSMAAGRRLAQAQEIIEKFPAVGAALSQGSIDLPRALVITELVEPLPDRALARTFVERVIDRAGQWTTGQLRARLRALLLAADPAWAQRRATAAVRGRRVEVRDNEDGSGDLWGRSLPPRDVAMVWERLSAIATAAKGAGDHRSVDQLRADAMVDLLAGEGVALGGPVGRHHGGLPVPDGDPGDPGPITHRSHHDRPPGDGLPEPGLPNPEVPDHGLPDHGLWDEIVWPAVLPEPPPEASPEWIIDSAVAAAGRPGAGTDAAAAGAGAGAGAPDWSVTPTALPGPRAGVVELQVPLTTLIGLTELPGHLRGFGPVIADIARHVAAEQRAGSWRYSLLNDLGEVVCHGPVRARPAASRRPSTSVAALVRARNPTCVAPGCRRPAQGCDLDHTVAWAQGGASTADNLGPLCRRHHRFKDHGGADLIQPTPGVFGWTTPRGLQYVTTPEPAIPDGLVPYRAGAP
ncbi:DUF222 domain-containing protein [Natronosporangium hydrolyticum]|uniref:DUF222 domain-containing protein n=1 Tax=Natronosporangium hydrolyticum TaxID=2811111 RepID=A0A895YPC6_9ACTN|nr:HNH endonuclease signature motif containing protein [Natronosporangium hydrolyticum]QSB16576.1 DUF222 domain-containing protein [Natronosporangium hydrolyticum]